MGKSVTLKISALIMIKISISANLWVRIIPCTSEKKDRDKPRSIPFGGTSLVCKPTQQLGTNTWEEMKHWIEF